MTNSTFIIESNRKDLISFIFNNNLLDIINELPNKLYEFFYTSDLEILLKNKWNSEKWIIVKVFTKMDGESASNKLDLLEDELSEKYEDNFLDNLLITMEFE